ncbi:bacterial regulatory helix-turn-helix, lysR family protein [Janthinobacterium agaricidamnosum NBRC 102515 = DSM 9628]|uniref:Bacterial regulatory helix-turn-helix, lysR family protein n=1 Tax=Janthinobacterium agaricidamnosum NBRC 102515 = DSM 9628 TaxID=1349767 RepID=W0V2R3_9BURK|nr:bacterial regulatory helix-turn-helix, lysR family protein [Janthinobacterium agaricidamnosum NBRC 102515 = DSM 9628]
MNYVQSNVSTRLMQLEEQLGVPLFERVGRKLVITEGGIKLLAYAEQLLQLADEAKSAVRGEGKPAGTLRIGSMETAAALRLPVALASFHSRFPDVHLELETGTTAAVLQQLLARSIDVALVAGPIVSDALQSHKVIDEELTLLTDIAHPEVTSPADIRNRTILSFRAGCVYRERLERWFARAAIAPRKIIEFGTFEAIVACVAAGMGVALMPKELLARRELLQTIKLHPLPEDLAKVQTSLVWRNDTKHHISLNAFVVCFLEQPLRAQQLPMPM